MVVSVQFLLHIILRDWLIDNKNHFSVAPTQAPEIWYKVNIDYNGIQKV